MQYVNQNADEYFPGNGSWSNVTDLCIAAHQDDIEIMAYGPIVACLTDKNRHFGAVVATDGAGSPRIGAYADYSDEQMKAVRIQEQRHAAEIGQYEALAQLGFSSKAIKFENHRGVSDEMKALLSEAQPDTLYIHNVWDKHDTHVATALRAIEAVRALPADKRPKRVVMLEVWRALDWLPDSDKLLFDTAAEPAVAEALLTVYESQVAGGKRYDLAAIGRRFANATFFESHATDEATSLSYALDVTDWAFDPACPTPQDLAKRYLQRFEDEVMDRLGRL